jgi:hypothetical protein
MAKEEMEIHRETREVAHSWRNRHWVTGNSGAERISVFFRLMREKVPSIHQAINRGDFIDCTTKNELH